MNSHRPPALLDRALLLVLHPRDRDTISGDLLEIYAEEKLPELGSFRARLWYLRQIFSIIPHRIFAPLGVSLMKTLSIAASFLVILACLWSASMEIIIRHPGFIPRTAFAVLILAYAALSFAYLRSPTHALQNTLGLAAVCVIVFGAFALITEMRSSHFDGYLISMALSLILQGTLMLAGIYGRRQLRPA